MTQTRFAVCPTCEGRGSHVNPAIDAHGLFAEDFDEDPDFEEDYFSGTYDVPCAECRGEKVVPRCEIEDCAEPALAKQDGYGDRRDRVSREHFATCYEHLKEWEREEMDSTAEMYATMEAERRMGA